MKAIKDLFPDIETCKTFAKLGLFGESLFVFTNFNAGICARDRIAVGEDALMKIIAPAPTTDEILEVLPKSLTGFYFLRMLINSIGQFICFYANDCDDLTANHKIQYDTYNNSPVQALAELLLKLKSANPLPL